MTAISTPSSTTSGDGDYPLTFAVDYPDRHLDRLSTAFRILTIIPIAILAGFLEGGSFATNAGASGTRYAAGGIGILVIPVVLMLLICAEFLPQPVRPGRRWDDRAGRRCVRTVQEPGCVRAGAQPY